MTRQQLDECGLHDVEPFEALNHSTLTGPVDHAAHFLGKSTERAGETRNDRDTLEQMRQADHNAWSIVEHRHGDPSRELQEGRQ
jgi:hypothetical protein